MLMLGFARTINPSVISFPFVNLQAGGTSQLEYDPRKRVQPDFLANQTGWDNLFSRRALYDNFGH